MLFSVPYCHNTGHDVISTEAHTEGMTSIEQTAVSQSDHLNCYCEHDITQEVSTLAVMEQV